MRLLLLALLLAPVSCKTPGASAVLASAGGSAPQTLAQLCDTFEQQPPPIQATLNALFQPFLQAPNASSECADLAALAVAAKSITLDLEDSASDLTPLSQAVALETVVIKVHKLFPKNLGSTLATLPALRKVQLRGHEKPYPKLAEELGRLPLLTHLAISGIAVETLSGLETLTSLRFVALDGTKVKSIAPLANAVSMQELLLNDAPVESLEPITNMLELKSLSCSRCRITDLTPLMATAQVEKLDLTYNATLTEILAVQYLPELRSLNLGYCNVSSLEPLKKNSFLRELLLAENPTKDLSPLVDLPIELLDVKANDIASLAPLAKMKAIRRVNAAFNKVGALPVFAPNHPLEYLVLTDTDATELCHLGAIQGLQKVVLQDDILNRNDLLQRYNCKGP